MSPAATPSAPPASAERWRTLLLLAAASVAATVAVGIATAVFPVLQEQFGLGNRHLGVFAAIYLLARALCGPLWGLLADRFGRRRVLLVAVLAWSGVIAGAGLARDYRELLVLYTLGVVGAVAVEPVAYSLLSDLFRPHERGRAYGALRALLGVGGGLLVPAVGWLAGLTDGWRLAFHLLGGLQLGVGLLLLLLLREPPPGAADGTGPGGTRFSWAALRALLTLPSFRLFALCHALATGLLLFFFVPAFLTGTRGYSLQTATAMLGLLKFGVVAGSLLGGLLGDWAERRDPRRGRTVLMQVYLAVFALLTVLEFQVAWRHPAADWVLLLALGVVFPVGFSGSVLPMLAAVVAPALRGTSFGLLASLCQGLSLAALSALIGALADRHGLPRMLFWGITVPFLLNFVLWFRFYRAYPADLARRQAGA